MNLLDIGQGIANFLGTGENSILGTIKSYFPPSMSEQEKAELSERIRDAEANRDIKLQSVVNEATVAFNDRIKDMEGTAADLRNIPILGPFMIFLRGSQRPIWGFATLYFDYIWLVGGNVMTSQQEKALIVINILVLGFLFGERAIKNVMPLITQMFIARGK